MAGVHMWKVVSLFPSKVYFEQALKESMSSFQQIVFEEGMCGYFKRT